MPELVRQYLCRSDPLRRKGGSAQSDPLPHSNGDLLRNFQALMRDDILECAGNAADTTPEGSASQERSASLPSMAGHRCGGGLAICVVHPSALPVDRPAN